MKASECPFSMAETSIRLRQIAFESVMLKFPFAPEAGKVSSLVIDFFRLEDVSAWKRRFLEDQAAYLHSAVYAEMGCTCRFNPRLLRQRRFSSNCPVPKRCLIWAMRLYLGPSYSSFCKPNFR